MRPLSPSKTAPILPTSEAPPKYLNVVDINWPNPNHPNHHLKKLQFLMGLDSEEMMVIHILPHHPNLRHLVGCMKLHITFPSKLIVIERRKWIRVGIEFC